MRDADEMQESSEHEDEDDITPAQVSPPKSQAELEIERAEKLTIATPHGGEPNIKIQVKIGERKSVSIPIASGDYVIHLMRKIREVEGIKEQEQVLIYTGHILKADKKLSEYNLGPNSTIHVVAKLRR